MTKQRTINPLHVKLCAHFRLDYDEVTYIEILEMVYVFNFVSQRIANESPSLVLSAIKSLDVPLKGRSKRRRLYQLFLWCQAQDMKASGKYNLTTLRPPQQPIKENYY